MMYKSPRAIAFIALVGVVLFCIAGCASAPDVGALAASGRSAPGARTVTVFVATDRTRGAGPASFTSGRSAELSYARYEISIPPTHVASRIEWPAGAQADPSQDFAIVGETALDEPGFIRAISSRPQSPSRSRDVAVFVHGYNTTYSESLLRVAQLAADSDIDAAPVLFAWPSQGSLTGYLADRESATFSRDHLARVLTAVATTPGVDKIMLVGHSMGAWLTAESLRELRLTGRDRVIARLHPVVLAAPDIDPDVFGMQMDAIGRLDPHLTVLVSTDDRALAVSALIAGEPGRIGNLQSGPWADAEATAHGVDVVDITSLSSADAFNHDRFTGSSRLLQNVFKPEDKPLSRAATGLAASTNVAGIVARSIGGATSEGSR